MIFRVRVEALLSALIVEKKVSSVCENASEGGVGRALFPQVIALGQLCRIGSCNNAFKHFTPLTHEEDNLLISNALALPRSTANHARSKNCPPFEQLIFKPSMYKSANEGPILCPSIIAKA